MLRSNFFLILCFTFFFIACNEPKRSKTKTTLNVSKTNKHVVIFEGVNVPVDIKKLSKKLANELNMTITISTEVDQNLELCFYDDTNDYRLFAYTFVPKSGGQKALRAHMEHALLQSCVINSHANRVFLLEEYNCFPACGHNQFTVNDIPESIREFFQIIEKEKGYREIQ